MGKFTRSLPRKWLQQETSNPNVGLLAALRLHGNVKTLCQRCHGPELLFLRIVVINENVVEDRNQVLR